jgi:hypothetical protein
LQVKFDRINLSNIPDYTSLLFMFTECIPLLKTNPSSFIRCNVLLNCSLWSDYAHYVYANSFMPSLELCRTLLNAEFIQGQVLGGGDTLWKVASSDFRPSCQSQSDIFDWLARILLAYSIPSKRDSINPMRENYAPNMTSFFRSIQYLIYLGYPKHWFNGFVQSILDTKYVVSKARYPLVRPNRYNPLDARQCVQLEPVLLEFSTLAALYVPMLGIGTLKDQPSAQSISEYTLCFEEGFNLNNFRRFLYSNVLGLIIEDEANADEDDDDEFFSDNGTLHRDLITQRYSGSKHLISVFRHDSGKNQIWFWMNEQSMNEMVSTKQKKAWHVSIIRTDSWSRITSPVKLAEAKKVQSFNATVSSNN